MISVIIPSYNRAPTVVRSVESVLNQTYRDLEVIVVDDGSTDSTEQDVAAIDDPRVRYVRTPTNGGACRARNLGIDEAEGDFIAFQDSDDVWRPEKLTSQLNELERWNADVCFCAMERHGYDHGARVFPTLPAGPVSRAQLVAKSLVSTQTILARREVFDTYRFDPTMPRLQDYEWVIRASATARFVFDPAVLVDVYLQQDSITSSGSQKELDAYERIVTQHEDLKETESGAYADILLHQARVQRRAGKDSRAAIRRSQEVAPRVTTLALLALTTMGIADKPYFNRLYR